MAQGSIDEIYQEAKLHRAISLMESSKLLILKALEGVHPGMMDDRRAARMGDDASNLMKAENELQLVLLDVQAAQSSIMRHLQDWRKK